MRITEIVSSEALLLNGSIVRFIVFLLGNLDQSKVDSEAKIDSPIQTELFTFVEAMILLDPIVGGARLVISFSIRSAGYMVKVYL